MGKKRVSVVGAVRTGAAVVEAALPALEEGAGMLARVRERRADARAWSSFRAWVNTLIHERVDVVRVSDLARRVQDLDP